MDSTREVVQKLAKLNLHPCPQTPVHVQEVNASHVHPPGPNQRPGPFDPTGQASFRTQSGTQFSLSIDQRTKPEEAIAAPFTATTGPESPKNIPMRKPFRNISRNLAESLSKGVKPRNPDDRHTSSITKCRDRMRTGVDFLRRDASKGFKRWLKEKERRHDSTRRATRAHRGGAISEGLRKRLGLKREGASLGQLEVIKEEEEEEKEEDLKVEEDMKMEEDMIMAD